MTGPLTVGSLFAGIGGLDLGLERAGMVVKWQVEIDPWCQRVLAKHWPDISRFGDVRECGAHNLEPVDLICGGFPCQDISAAGRRIGISGARSGLWREYARIIGEIRPRFVLVENVADLRSRGLGVVLEDLAACGYDAEWDCLPAAAFGAPHRRDMAFVVAYAASQQFQEPQTGDGREVLTGRATQIRRCEHWHREPGIRRVVDGIPAGVDRLRGLGNAVVPQVAEWVGKRIVEADRLWQKEREAA